MARIFDPALKAREQLLAAERRARAKAEAAAVEAGVAETMALSTARGAEFEAPAHAARATPYKRQAGLDWLGRGLISSEPQAG